jgi:hypothetical protein
MKKQTCILVLGMHRSGTSALTGVLSLLDIYLSRTIVGDDNNKKGYFENQKLNQLNDELLASIDSSWDDIFYSEKKLDNIKNIDKLKAIIKKEFEYSNIFAIKDPRLAFLFPVYKEILEELDIDIKVIIPYRNPIEVASSLYARDGINMEKGMLLWGYYFLLAEKYSRGHKRVFVSFDDLMNETEETVKIISKSLNIDLDKKYFKNKQKIEEFLEPHLKHHNISMDNLSSKTPVIVQKILALKSAYNSKTTSKKFDILRTELFSYQKLFYNHDIISFLEELQKNKESLAQKEQTIAHKDKELTQIKESFKQSQEAIAQKEQKIKEQQDEIEALKDELVLFYEDSSCILAKTIRKIKEFTK